MPYRVGDNNNGLFSEAFDTLEEAEAELQRCIAEGVERTLSEGEVTREEAETDAADFFFIEEVEG